MHRFAAWGSPLVKIIYVPTHAYSKPVHAPPDDRRKAGVSQPKPWLESAHPSAVLLDTAMVAQSLLQQANAALEEAVADGGWADIASLIPDELSADAPQLLPQCPCVAPIEKEGGAVFAGSCLVRGSILQDSA